MEVKNECAASLSNFEVYNLLQDIQSGRNGQKKPNKFLPSLATISFSTSKYLEKTACCDQNPEVIAKFVTALEPYNLTKSEKLQLLNHRPTTAVEIQLIVEESEERLTEEQTEQILDLVARLLPGPEQPEEEMEEEMS